MNVDYEHIYETATAGAEGANLANFTPENTPKDPKKTIEVVNGQSSKTLTERLTLRKQYNSHLFEAIKNRNLRETLDDDDSALNDVRYKLQTFANGGTPTADGGIDGEKDGPSSYEAWRKGLNDKHRSARVQQEKNDRESPFASPKHTDASDKGRDGQVDQFLDWWLDKYGTKGKK
jgi:hypothetical protein